MKGTVQVQLRMPKESVREIDEWVSEGKFKSRSDAVKTIIALYEDKIKTRDFFKMLMERSKQVEDKPKILIPLDDVNV